MINVSVNVQLVQSKLYLDSYILSALGKEHEGREMGSGGGGEY